MTFIQFYECDTCGETAHTIRYAVRNTWRGLTLDDGTRLHFCSFECKHQYALKDTK